MCWHGANSKEGLVKGCIVGDVGYSVFGVRPILGTKRKAISASAALISTFLLIICPSTLWKCNIKHQEDPSMEPGGEHVSEFPTQSITSGFPLLTVLLAWLHVCWFFTVALSLPCLNNIRAGTSPICFWFDSFRGEEKKIEYTCICYQAAIRLAGCLFSGALLHQIPRESCFGEFSRRTSQLCLYDNVPRDENLASLCFQWYKVQELLSAFSIQLHPNAVKTETGSKPE